MGLITDMETAISSDKVMTLEAAVERFVRNGSSVYVAGFSHLIAFAAAHEIIRQHRRDLTLIRATPDMVYDQMVGAGCAAKLIFSWAGNPGVGMLRAIRRAIEGGEITIEEYTHHQMVGALRAGGSGLPFYSLRSESGGDLSRFNPNIASLDCPFTGIPVTVVRSITPDVAFIHGHRADRDGNVQVWGITGDIREAAFAAKTVVATVEEIVDREVVRRDPNRTIVPAQKVAAVVEEPWGAHPSFAQGSYDRDNLSYRQWAEVSRDPLSTEAWLTEWIYEIPDRRAYMGRLGDRRCDLRPEMSLSGEVNYGTTS